MVIPLSVRTIQSGAFSNCTQLSSVTIRSGEISLGNEAFSNSSNLSEFTVEPEALISFGGQLVFRGTSLNLATQAELRRLGYNGNF